MFTSTSMLSNPKDIVEIIEMQMFLLKFSHEGKNYFLHDGTVFIGGMDLDSAKKIVITKTFLAISIGGFDITPIDVDGLRDSVGMPYNIIDFTGNGQHFMGVEIKK